MRRLDIGCASYGKPQHLKNTIEALQRNSVTDWRLAIVSNPHPHQDNRELIAGLADRDCRIVPIWNTENVGYAGAVNQIVQWATTEYIAFLDDDATIGTHGWDETLCGFLDRQHEIGLIFPNGGPYPINRGAYTEVEWGVGFCWIVNRMCATDVANAPYGNGPETFMDATIGHQNECDLALRVRMCGWKCAAVPEVYVQHMATATNDPASTERINRGVLQFVDKWNNWFGGKNQNYHSPNVLRWEDWNALYMEQWFQTKVPGLNDNPEVVTIEGTEYDLIKVPRLKGFYRSRII